MPYDQGLIFQDGRPLIYDSGDYPAAMDPAQRRSSAGTSSSPTGEQARQGRRVGIGLACYVEGTGVGPYEGGHVQVETSGRVKVATGPDHPGPGPPDGARARSSPTSSACRSRTSRSSPATPAGCRYAVGTFASRAAVMSGSAIALAARSGAREGAAGGG